MLARHVCAYNRENTEGRQIGCAKKGSRVNLRPYLGALLRDDREAYLFFAKLYPRERTKRIERSSKLWLSLATQCDADNTRILMNLVTLCIVALKRILSFDAGEGESRDASNTYKKWRGRRA